MADLEKILRLVAEGALTAEEADRIIAALQDDEPPAAGERQSSGQEPRPTGGRHLRIEVTEGGRRVVNLRVPLNIAGLATTFVPGLSDDDTQRIREAIRSGLRGPILDIGSDEGDRVVIATE